MANAAIAHEEVQRAFRRLLSGLLAARMQWEQGSYIDAEPRLVFVEHELRRLLGLEMDAEVHRVCVVCSEPLEDDVYDALTHQYSPCDNDTRREAAYIGWAETMMAAAKERGPFDAREYLGLNDDGSKKE